MIVIAAQIGRKRKKEVISKKRNLNCKCLGIKPFLEYPGFLIYLFIELN